MPKTQKPSKVEAQKALRNRKAPVMPLAAATIELEEAAIVAEADAEFEAAQAKFAPADEVESDDDADSDAGDDAESDDDAGDDAGDDAESDAPLVAADGTSLAARTPSEARAAYLKQLREDGPAKMKAFTLRKILRTSMKKAARGLDGWAKDGTHGAAFAKANAQVAEATALLAAACDILDGIPKTWRPATAGRKWKGGGKLELVGTTCDIAEARRKDFEDVLDAVELTGLKVERLAGKLYACLTKKGVRVFLPRAALAPVPSVLVVRRATRGLLLGRSCGLGARLRRPTQPAQTAQGHSTMRLALLHAAMFTPTSFGWGLPLLLEDEPGTAKTSVIKAYADSIGLPIKVLSPGTDGEGAFGVIPVPSGGRLTYPAPDWADDFANGGIVFCDEVTTAPPLIQTSIMGILTERRIGGMKFGRRVRTLGACNPVESAANGYDLAPPLANRFGHVRWGAPSVEQHTNYMLGRADLTAEAAVSSAKDIEDKVLAAWGDAYARAVGLETSFLGAQTGMKNQCPKAGSSASSRAWPSDRTWEYATLALASSYVHKLSEEDRDALIAGFIGNQAYEAWATFIEQADLPNISDLLDGKVKWAHDPARLDVSAAVLNSAAALLAQPGDKRRQARADVLWGILTEVATTAADLAVPCTKSLIASQLHATKASVKVLAKMNPVLNASTLSMGEI